MRIKIAKALLLLVALFAVKINAKIHYQIDIDQPQHHLAKVTMTIPKGQELLVVNLPTWRTGRYTLVHPANGIRFFAVKDSRGRELKWSRQDKSSWRIENPTKRKLTIEYQVYANELGARTRHIDSSHAYIDATAVLMYASDLMDMVHQVELTVPKKWRSYSGMTQTDDHEFIAQSYHQLASSPIETGISEFHEFSEGERDYQLVIWGHGNFDGRKMAKDLKALVTQGTTIWSDYPFKKYLFIVHATSGAGGATEHINSTVIQRPRLKFAPRAEYLKFLRTAAHEFVHTWNVKAYRPENLVPYDYQQENYSNLLWVAEGSTSYFQNRLLLTAQLESVDEFLSDLASRIHSFNHKPGHQVQSVAAASFEKWIAQSGDFANNHSVSIYSEGYMASWLLDFQLLEDSQLKYGYKDLHNALYQFIHTRKDDYQRYQAVGFNADLMREIGHQLSGQNYERWWQQTIESPLDIDFESLLAQAGLKFKSLKDKDYSVWTGFKSKDKDGLMTLTTVEKGSPAWQAGLTKDDQVVAVDGHQAVAKDWSKLLERFKSGQRVTLSFFRNQQLRKTQLTFGKVVKKPRSIEIMKSPSEEQKALFKAWLGVEFPESKVKDSEKTGE